MFIKTLILASAFLGFAQFASAATDKIICFYASWAVYRSGEGAFKPEDINANLCTHVFYAFMGVNSDGTLAILDSWNEVDLGGLTKVSGLKSTNPDLKVLASIGGWNAGNAILNGVAASTKLRANLISSSIQFFKQWDFDGLDIDWEYPADSDKSNFVKLLQEMRTAFDEEGYVLSVTASAAPLTSYDVPEITKLVDLINLMTYDFNVPDNMKTGHNAPLYGAASGNSSVSSWIDAGVDKSKLTISVPFYGHSYTLKNETNHGLEAAANVGIGGPFTKSPGTVGYNEICEYYDDYLVVWDDESQVPYEYSGTNWFSFDNPQSIGLKAKFAKDEGLAGVSVWSIDTDDFNGACGDAYPLLQAIYDNIH